MRVDVVVVGGGIIGKTISYSLAKRGVSVACVGNHHSAQGTASMAAGAMLGVLGEVTADASGPLDQDELHFRAAAGLRYPAFLVDLAEDSGIPVPLGRGTFVVANATNHADQANLRAIAQSASLLAQPFSYVDASAVRGLRPARGHEPTGVLHLPDEGFVDSGQVMNALQSALENLPSASVILSEVRSVEVTGDRAAGVRLADGSLVSSESVVLANGVGTQELLDSLGGRAGSLPRLLPGKGVSLVVEDVTDDFSEVIRTPNRDFACGSHVVPRAGGALYLGATNRVSATPGSDASVTPGELHGLLHSLMHEINTSIRTASLVSSRYGLRPLSSDRYPLIGETDLPGLLIATGTYRNGVLMAPAIGHVIACQILGLQADVKNPFSPLAPFRSRGLRPGLEDVLDDGLRHLVSFILEPGGHLPYDRQRELQAFITQLARLALSDNEETLEIRAQARALFDTYPIAEMVPQLYYQLAARQEEVKE